MFKTFRKTVKCGTCYMCERGQRCPNPMMQETKNHDSIESILLNMYSENHDHDGEMIPDYGHYDDAEISLSKFLAKHS